MFKKSFFLVAFLLEIICTANSQDSIQQKTVEDFVQFKGYLKELNSTTFSDLNYMSTYSFIHNRLNFKFYPAKTITGALEVRNRIFYGQQVQDTPGFGKLLDNNDELSALLVDEKSLVAHTTIDRLWISWANNKWEIRAGRQRINWGKTLVWNSNDLFNTYNFADFDYEEQPGSDALKLVYFPSGMSAIELAVKPGTKRDETVAAGLWRFNKLNYDVQFLGGLYNTDIALGTGWAGNIKNAGFKGEATWFQPKDHLTDAEGILSATVSMDYSFKKPVYVHGGILYNNHPKNNPGNIFSFGQAFSGGLSAKNLMPSDWSFFEQVSVTATPLLHADVSIIYGTDPDFLFAMPTIGYSISNNWDISLTGQSIFVINSNFTNATNSIFLRVKWSF